MTSSRRRPLLGAACCAALLSLAPAALAQPASWAPLDGPYATNFQGVAVTETGTPFAISYTEIYRYGTAAARWNQVESTFTGSFHDVASGSGQRVWAGTGGIFGSLNGGQAWDWFPVRTTPHSGTPASIGHVSVGPDGTVYASGLTVDAGGGVVEGGYRSTDNGASWPGMAVAPVDVAFVGTTAFAATTDGVVRSADRGATWASAGLAGQAVRAVAASGTRLSAATEGTVWASADGGATWDVAGQIPVVALAASADGAMWGASPNGLYRSANAGASWSSVPAAFAGQPVSGLAIGGATHVALLDGTPFLSTDAGATWTAATGGFTLDNATAAVAAAGVLGVAAIGAGPFVSRDGGATWATWTEGLASPTVQEFVADPAEGWVLARAQNSVYRAELAGGPWAPLALPQGDVPLRLATDGAGHVYALARSAASALRLYRSADRGSAWAVAYEPGTGSITSVAAGGGVVAAPVTADGGFGEHRLIVSADGGATWLDRPYPVVLPFGTPPTVWVDGAGRVYVRTTTDRLLRSSDLGATWTTLGPSGVVLSVLSGPAGVLCLGLNRGAACSTDDGATFAPANAGLPPDPENGGQTTPVLDLLRDGTRYFALTPRLGLFGGAGSTASEPGASGLVVRGAAPNPASGRTVVRFDLPYAAEVGVRLFDVLGREVLAVPSRAVAAGPGRELTLDLSGLRSGVYQYRLDVGGGGPVERRSGRLVVVR